MNQLAVPSVERRESGSTQRPHGSSRAVARLAVELGLPVAVYYGLRAANVDIFLALLFGAVVSAVIAAAPVIRYRRLDGMAAFVTASWWAVSGFRCWPATPSSCLPGGRC